MKQTRNKTKLKPSQADTAPRGPVSRRFDTGRVASLSLIVALSALVFVAADVLVALLLFVAGQPISKLNLPVAGLVTVVCGWFINKRYALARPLRSFLLSGGIVLAVFLGALFISGRFYDLSTDGQTYQQEAIIQLAGGWNPLQSAPLDGVHSIWINHYPKTPWLLAATIYKLTGEIEQAKAFNLLLLFMSCCGCLAALLTFRPQQLGRAVALSLVLAFNPICISQIFSFYIDCQIAALLLSAIAFSYLAYAKRDRLLAAVVVLPVVLLINTKFTAIVYVLVLSAGLAGWLILAKQRRGARTVLLIGVGGLLLGLLVVGFNPYVTNTLRKGHPFYPLAGKGAVDIRDPAALQSMELPAGFREKSRVAKLVISLFSRSENAGDKQPSYKLPFVFDSEEVLWLGERPDIRVGGFGPLFSGTLVLALATVVCLTAAWRKDRNPVISSIIALVALLWLSALVNPECWWARYVPQLWWTPALLALPALYLTKQQPLRLLGWAVLMVMALNSALILHSYLTVQDKYSKALKAQLAELVQINQPIRVVFNGCNSNRLRFDKLGIDYQEIPAPPVGEQPFGLTASRAIFFFPPEY